MNSVKITISVLFLSILLSACAQEKKDSTILPIVETGVLASIPEPSNIPPISNTELEQSGTESATGNTENNIIQELKSKRFDKGFFYFFSDTIQGETQSQEEYNNTPFVLDHSNCDNYRVEAKLDANSLSGETYMRYNSLSIYEGEKLVKAFSDPNSVYSNYAFSMDCSRFYLNISSKIQNPSDNPFSDAVDQEEKTKIQSILLTKPNEIKTYTITGSLYSVFFPIKTGVLVSQLGLTTGRDAATNFFSFVFIDTDSDTTHTIPSASYAMTILDSENATLYTYDINNEPQSATSTGGIFIQKHIWNLGNNLLDTGDRALVNDYYPDNPNSCYYKSPVTVENIEQCLIEWKKTFL